MRTVQIKVREHLCVNSASHSVSCSASVVNRADAMDSVAGLVFTAEAQRAQRIRRGYDLDSIGLQYSHASDKSAVLA